MNLIFLFERVREVWKRIVNIATGVQDVRPEAGAAMLRAGARVLDVREPEEWAHCIIPGSFLIPLRDLSVRVEEVAALRNEPVLVVCHGGKRSATACRLLRRMGFSGQVNLAGGVRAQEKGPTVRQLDMGDLKLHALTADDREVLAPVELERFARTKGHPRPHPRLKDHQGR